MTRFVGLVARAGGFFRLWRYFVGLKSLGNPYVEIQ